MSLNEPERQALGCVEDGLAGSDPGLASMLTIFSRLAAGEEMPAREKIRVRRGRPAAHRPGKALPQARRLDPRLGWQQAVLLLWAVIDGVDLDVAARQTLAVMGPSGRGKSTLLHLLGGLDRPTAGELFFDDRRVDQLSERSLAQLRRKEIGFVFQAFELLDELTAQENVELPALLARSSPRQARRRTRQLLEQVGLGERASHLPSALSGGQRQRVAIARALVNEPAVILADEPTGNLDSAATLEVLRLFGVLRAEGLTLVVVTHDERVAATADRLISMRDGAFIEDTGMVGTGGPDSHFPARLNG